MYGDYRRGHVVATYGGYHYGTTAALGCYTFYDTRDYEKLGSLEVMPSDNPQEIRREVLRQLRRYAKRG